MCYITRARSLRSLVSTKLSASSFSRGLRPLVSTQPLAASSIAWCARNVTPYPCTILEKSTYPRLSVSLRGPGALRAFNGRCAPWFQRSFQLLVSVGDCVPQFQRSLTAASSIALIRNRQVLGRFYKLVSKVGWCFYLAWMPFRLSRRIFLSFTEITQPATLPRGK